MIQDTQEIGQSDTLYKKYHGDSTTNISGSSGE